VLLGWASFCHIFTELHYDSEEFIAAHHVRPIRAIWTLLSVPGLLYAALHDGAKAQNLISDPGFDQCLSSNDCLPAWTLEMADPVYTGFYYIGNNRMYRNGNAAPTSAILRQDVSTIVGGNYVLRFDLINTQALFDSLVVALGDSAFGLPGTSPSTDGMDAFSFVATAKSTVTTVSFIGYDSSSYWYVDNVSLTPVPGSLPLGSVAMGFFYARKLRQRIAQGNKNEPRKYKKRTGI